MTDIRYILSADDFGPIDFINQGIIDLVQIGALNSVQVLSNMDAAKLMANLTALHKAVPDGKIVDLGVHFSLVSGSPISAEGKTFNEAKNMWGVLIEEDPNNPVKCQFKDYTKFDWRFVNEDKTSAKYQRYSIAITRELKMQKERLVKITDKVNLKQGSMKLQVTSVSQHHNMFTIHQDLVEMYRIAAGDLAFRPFKIIPNSSMKNYYGLVLPIKNTPDTKVLRKTMKALNRHFKKNEYHKGPADFTIKCPAYSDTRYYMSLGSLSKSPLQGIASRVKKFKRLVEYAATSYKPLAHDLPEPLIVEVMFHVGHRIPTEKRKYKDMVKAYPGIAPKYFDNRQTEHDALKKLRNSKRFTSLFENQLASWNESKPAVYVVSK